MYIFVAGITACYQMVTRDDGKANLLCIKKVLRTAWSQ